jgi:NAD(P)-dependent dehydrogenase (short-subunit alcohol dehydrogenase family)
VFATARSLKTLSNLSAAGIEVFTLDVTSQESIAALKAEIASLTDGKLDVLYNNAGVCKSYTLRYSVSLNLFVHWTKCAAEVRND